MMHALFITADGKISIQRLQESPERLNGLTRAWVRTGVSLKRVRGFGRGLFVYEQTEQQPLMSLAVAYRGKTLVKAIRAARKAKTLCT
jgi:hypothetical protein